MYNTNWRLRRASKELFQSILLGQYGLDIFCCTYNNFYFFCETIIFILKYTYASLFIKDEEKNYGKVLSVQPRVLISRDQKEVGNICDRIDVKAAKFEIGCCKVATRVMTGYTNLSV